jgi:nicotinamidase-related amidase
MIDRGRAAVIAVDFQHDVIGSDGAFAPLFYDCVERAGVVPAAVRLLDGARAAHAKIVYSRAVFQAGYPELVPNIPVLAMVAEYGCLLDGTRGAAIIDDVTPHHGDVVIGHHRVSCFQGTELDVILRGGRVDTIALAGVATNLAIESTARAASDLGYRTIVLSDACSTTTDASHNASLESLGMLAEVMSLDEFLTTLD